MPRFNRISQIVFKVLLLSIYTAFFSVSGYLRYFYPQTDITYQELSFTASTGISQQAHQLVNPGHKSTESFKSHPKQKRTHWLNKRFSPESPVVISPLAPDADPEYLLLRKIYYSYDQHIITANTNHASLRAPPAVS